jgi:hypothetical protein
MRRGITRKKSRRNKKERGEKYKNIIIMVEKTE